jgi:pSer/pThr/pTyr-binding forkhead associated (FHA) protein
LAGAPADPGISRLHAVLERRADGSYAVRDLGSTNGTAVNDDPSPVGREVAVPLKAGDRIRLGAWTTITLRRSSEVVPREDA